jgi:hypothetical protein
MNFNIGVETEVNIYHSWISMWRNGEEIECNALELDLADD